MIPPASKTCRRPVLGRPALIAALAVVALALAGCGRKSGLDAPPGAAAEPPPQSASPAWSSPAGTLAPAPPSANAPAPDKRIFLDTLLN
ncbi:MAG: hypothetical protein EPO23_10970 [Xanthobacteraceae bacterium]|nr:MAG: hypothetical protein EPO23_10970 [Xanthobacteraceae bacterium]